MISCPTPNTKLNLDEIGEEPVKMEVAMNGQDYMSTSSVYFKFVGSKSPSGYGITWIIAIIIGTIVLVFLIYFIIKAFSGSSGVNVENIPLAGQKNDQMRMSPQRGYPAQQNISPQRPSQGTIVKCESAVNCF